MFPYRELFLAVIISLASITLADVLVQPGYQHQSDSNSRYSQPVPQYQINSLSEQYPTEQLPNQELSWYLPIIPRGQNIQTVYPHYESDQDKARSNLVSYPHRSLYSNHHYHYSPRPKLPHYAKIGGRGYARPSVIVGYPKPLIVHHRYRRSLESDPTTTESSKSAIVAHDNDVAAKSSLTDVKHLTANDSLLPEHEPVNTNDKRVENRQIKNDHVMMPRLFDLYPENIYSGRYLENAKVMQQPHPSYPSMPNFKASEAVKTILSTTTQEEHCSNDDKDSRLFTNRPYAETKSLEEEYPDTDDNFDNNNRNNDEDRRLLMNRPVRWEPYLQSSNTDDYNTDNKYRAASYRQGDSQIFYTMLLHNAMRGVPGSYNYNLPMQKEEENQQILRQKYEEQNKVLREYWAMINGAKQQTQFDHMTMFIPRKAQLGIEVQDYPYNRTRDVPCSTQFWGPTFYCSPKKPIYERSSADDTPVGANCPIRHYENPSPINQPSSTLEINSSKIRIIPNYDEKYYTNINDPNNLAPEIPQTRSQSLDTYNHSPENIQVVSSDLKYDDNTYPSDTQLYDMFSSPVYY